VKTDVCEILEAERTAPLLLTCEHASNELPPPYTWPPSDLWLVHTHWAVDLGIADVTRALAAALEVPAVLGGFSRLLVDANRAAGDPTLFRTVADGRTVALNAQLTDAERRERVARFHAPYHAAIDLLLLRYPAAGVIVSMHSFTPVYENGPPRGMEIGVLFDTEDALAAVVMESLAADGWAVAANEPYSGKAGLLYAAAHHANRHGRRALELEIRQDVAADAYRRPALVSSIAKALRAAIYPSPA
jgi:predicted N-formylglutamate amidohydrolase